MAQAEAADVAEITDVQISSSEEGVIVTLTSTQPLSAEASRVSGNALITEISNATLNLTDESIAEQFGPSEGIDLVLVSSLEVDRGLFFLSGTDAVPAAEIGETSGNFVLSVTPGALQSGEASTEESEAIQLTVTAATRTEASPLDVPQSIQVIPRELIEDRAANSIVEALRTSPGVISSFDNSLLMMRLFAGFLLIFVGMD